MRIDAATRILTLLGHPVEHSLSPCIHNAAFRAQGVNAVYVASPVRPDALSAAVEGLRALRFLGANVTVPHKQAVLPLLDTVTAEAEAVGAVNTIVAATEDGGTPLLRGDNTDVAGFLEPLEASPAEDLRGATVLVFGAGGAARAVVYALLRRFAPERLTLAVRRPPQAERLAADFADYDEQAALHVVDLREAGAAVRTSRLVVNATPLGMHPEPEGTPWPAAEDFHAEQIVYDLVYNPQETRLLRDAAAQGAVTLGGIDMLIGQAAAAYTQWTGQTMPRGAVRRALRDALRT